MAACSSGNSSPLVLRITYNELVAYADELDRKKDTKHSKKKHQEKSEEKNSKPARKPEMKHETDVSKKNDERQEVLERTESNVNYHKDKQIREKTKQESKKDKKKLPGSKPRRKSSPRTENNVDDSRHKDSVSNGDKVNVIGSTKKSKKETKMDTVEKDSESYELDLRARTGGVLRLSKDPVHNAVESPRDAKPRGIIKLPEGVDIHCNDRSEEQESFKTDASSRQRTMSNSCDSELYYPDLHPENKVLKYKEVHFKDVEAGIDHRGEVKPETGVAQTITNCEECAGIQDTAEKNEQGSVKQTKVEKKLKTLHQQKAQKLMRAVAQKEMLLSNLLSRDMLDKAAFEKVCTLSKEIQDAYKGIIMLDVSFAVQQEVDQNLWRNAFYKVIETFRKYGKLFLGYAGKTQVLSPEEISNCLKKFLEDAETFYKGLLEFLQKGHGFSVQDVVNQPRKAEKLGKSAKLALLSSHHTLICLGDIERYQAQFQPNQSWASMRSWYLKASKLAPKNGKPYNQLGVIAVLANRKLDSVYFYIRSLAASNPILTAREKLTTIFYELQKKADKIQRIEDEKTACSQQQVNQMKGKDYTGRAKGRSVFGEVAKGLGLISEHKNTHGRHEVWIFFYHGVKRRVVLTDNGKVQEVNSAGEPVSESKNEENPAEPVKESPKISLQEVNKKFVLHFLCAHGHLYSRIGMERLPTLQYQLLGEFHTLLEYPSCSAISRSNLVQMIAINMFAIDNTVAQDSTEQYVRVGTPQDQAMNLAVEMFILLVKACCTLLQSIDFKARSTHEGLSAPLRQFLPAVKVFADWLVCHADLWQVSSISTHGNLWESVSQFTNALSYVDIDNVHNEDGDEIVTLYEDEFLAGFKPLNTATRPMCRVSDAECKNLSEDYLRCQCLKEFAAFLVSLDNPPLEFDDGKGEFSAMIKSTPVSPVKESAGSVLVHLDTSQHNEQEESDDDEDDVIIESEDEHLDSGDEMEKDLKELKAKKDALKKQVDDHKEREDKAKAVIEEHISKPRLMLENYPTYLVPDTNCFVDHLDGLKAIVACEAFTLVVPLIVINELDGLKRDFHVNKYNDLQHAQYVLENARCAIDFLEYEFSQRNPQVKTVTSKGSELETIAFRSEDPSGRRGKGCNDDIILSCCLHYCEENFVHRLATECQPITIQRKVVLMTDDRNLRVKAYTRNVPVLTVPQFRKMARL